MEHTTTENAVNPDLQELDQIVNYVKHDEHMEDLHMKWDEYEEMIWKNGHEEGRMLEKSNTDRERQRADAAEARVRELEQMLANYS